MLETDKKVVLLEKYGLIKKHFPEYDVDQNVIQIGQEPQFHQSMRSIMYVLASCVGLFLAMFWVCCGIAWDISDPEDNFWFQRSGAVLVATAFYMEYLISRSYRLHAAVYGYQLMPRYEKLTNILQILGVILGIAGTVIWAYGDLPFKGCK